MTTHVPRLPRHRSSHASCRASCRALALAHAAALVLSAALLPGCLPPGGDECSRAADDCGRGLACSNTGDCEPADSLVTIRINWTFNGIAPTPQDPDSCAGADRLSVSFTDVDFGENVVFQPVLCSLGQILFDRVSSRFDQVTLKAHDADGRVLDQATADIERPDTSIAIDLRL